MNSFVRRGEAPVAYAKQDLAVIGLILARCEAGRRKRSRWHLGWWISSRTFCNWAMDTVV